MNAKRICLVSPGHLASNPRLVKEANALHEAGYAVRVVAGDYAPGLRPLDDTILARAPWLVVKIGLGGRPRYLARRLRQELTRKAFGFGVGGLRQAIWALSPITQSLAKAATAERADLYIGHYLAALPAAAKAARRYNAILGFDAEDDHVGELLDASENWAEIAVRRRIEAQFLPHCQHLTAASPGIAHAYRVRYGVIMTPILNVFPLAEAPSSAIASPGLSNCDGVVSVYWFSQTVGPGRGLESFIKAMGKMRGLVKLSIRGSDFLGYSARLKAIAAEVGVADRIYFLPSAPPAEMARLAAPHDVGLASELSTPPHRAICLSNKIFTYLLAGIPVLLSDTPAQRNLAQQLGSAARLVDLNKHDQVAQALDDWTMNVGLLAAAKREAWHYGQTRFNWDKEKERFLQSVDNALERRGLEHSTRRRFTD
jgi:glycosyltransferase involved in cell wall biosynthesis